MTIPTIPTIETHELILRPWRASDSAALRSAMQDQEIRRWFGIDTPYTLEDAEMFIANTTESWEARRAAHFVVTHIDTGERLGYIATLSEDRFATLEVTYWTVLAARGAGVATRALSALLDWIAHELSPTTIELSMIDGNAASQKVAEANGFLFSHVVEGATTLDGQPADERTYSLPHRHQIAD